MSGSHGFDLMFNFKVSEEAVDFMLFVFEEGEDCVPQNRVKNHMFVYSNIAFFNCIFTGLVQKKKTFYLGFSRWFARLAC